jgi:hypothetical protein
MRGLLALPEEWSIKVRRYEPDEERPNGFETVTLLGPNHQNLITYDIGGANGIVHNFLRAILGLSEAKAIGYVSKGVAADSGLDVATLMPVPGAVCTVPAYALVSDSATEAVVDPGQPLLGRQQSYRCTPKGGGEPFTIHRAPDSWELRECEIEEIGENPAPTGSSERS